MKITALVGVKLYKFTLMVKVAIISVLWEILLKLLTTLIWQKRHNDQCIVMVGDTCFLKTTNVFRGECRLCKVAKVMMNKNKKVRNVEGLANRGRVILELAILQGDECDLLPRPQVEDVQGGGVYLDGQVEGQDEVDRNLEVLKRIINL